MGMGDIEMKLYAKTSWWSMSIYIRKMSCSDIAVFGICCQSHWAITRAVRVSNSTTPNSDPFKRMFVPYRPPVLLKQEVSASNNVSSSLSPVAHIHICWAGGGGQREGCVMLDFKKLNFCYQLQAVKSNRKVTR